MTTGFCQSTGPYTTTEDKQQKQTSANQCQNETSRTQLKSELRTEGNKMVEKQRNCMQVYDVVLFHCFFLCSFMTANDKN